MPAAPLFTATLEQGINRLLALDPDSPPRLAKLAGSRLVVFIEPLDKGVVLAFSDKVDVLATEQGHAQSVETLGPRDCCIRTRMEVLPELSQTSQLTRLIQQGALSVEGELQVAQQVSALFQQLDIDWEEQLAHYTGDVIAHQMFTVANRTRTAVEGFLARASAGLGNALVEEKQLAAHRLAVVHFSDEVNRLRDDVDRFEVRLSKLHEQLKQ